MYVRGFGFLDRLGSGLSWARRPSPLSWMKSVGTTFYVGWVSRTFQNTKKAEKELGEEGMGV